jgi:hypothetical protein
VKLRIRENSLRLRLSKGEVASLGKDGLVSGSTEFPGERTLRYTIESSPASVAPAAFFSDNTITVRVPESSVLAWSSSEQVAIDGEQRLDNGTLLSILVEKDFACLAPRAGEDESDLYPHPQAHEGGC